MGKQKKIKPNLILRDQAIIDVDEAGKWYEQQREGLSLDFELCVEAGLEDILLNPKSYQLRYKGIVRVRYIKRFPFGIHYVLKESNHKKSIYVIAILHTSQNPSSWNDRLKK